MALYYLNFVCDLIITHNNHLEKSSRKIIPNFSGCLINFLLLLMVFSCNNTVLKMVFLLWNLIISEIPWAQTFRNSLWVSKYWTSIQRYWLSPRKSFLDENGIRIDEDTLDIKQQMKGFKKKSVEKHNQWPFSKNWLDSH